MPKPESLPPTINLKIRIIMNTLGGSEIRSPRYTCETQKLNCITRDITFSSITAYSTVQSSTKIVQLTNCFQMNYYKNLRTVRAFQIDIIYFIL